MNQQQFEKLSVYDQRIFICKDVLQRLGEDKFIEERGIYSALRHKKNGRKVALNNLDVGAKHALEKYSCAVCAKGSLVMSWVANFNSKDLSEVLQKDEIEELWLIFPDDMRDMMENMFEGYSDRRVWSDNSDWIWFPDIKIHTLREVMNNIINNGGYLSYENYTFGKIN